VTAHQRDVVQLFGATGAFFLSISMLLPTLPLYVRDLGGSPIEVGIIIGAFSVGVLLARPFAGRAVDRGGRRKVLLLGALVAAAVAPFYLITAFAALVAVRVVHGAGLSAFTSASTVLVADLAPAGRRTEFLGWLSTSGIVAFAIGPVIGIEVAQRWGWIALFVLVSICGLAAVVCATGLSRPATLHGSERRVDYRAAILRREVVVPTVTMLLVISAHGGVFTFLPLMLEERLSFNFGLYFLVYSSASLCVRIVAGWLSRRIGDGPMIWGGLGLYAAGIFLMPLVQDSATMVISAVLFGLGFGMYQPAIYSMVADAASDRARGMVLSVLLGAFDLGMGIGGLVAGPTVAAFGVPAFLAWLAVVPVIAAMAFVGLLGWRPRPSTEAEGLMEAVVP
jgi:predicted MFS family arabinose efflux permease